MVKALIFDFDGLILDTETSEYRALQEIFKEHSAELPLVFGDVDHKMESMAELELKELMTMLYS
ncbi:hypothetical protein DS031_12105 [Bacillus taeanensis]|uniref:HAD family phosphatase n=1 Tax=Bacillus taeanensis TaxID=273032 RepID=A0A366XZM1_9BACI|nr:HAD hydrolase-like protein [Bacillus taeanensis]RBW69371.1 hypothetical protein DS031_12105 [Bacillus taeanensis]